MSFLINLLSIPSQKTRKVSWKDVQFAYHHHQYQMLLLFYKAKTSNFCVCPFSTGSLITNYYTLSNGEENSSLKSNKRGRSIPDTWFLTRWIDVHVMNIYLSKLRIRRTALAFYEVMHLIQTKDVKMYLACTYLIQLNIICLYCIQYAYATSQHSPLELTQTLCGDGGGGYGLLLDSAWLWKYVYTFSISLHHPKFRWTETFKKKFEFETLLS